MCVKKGIAAVFVPLAPCTLGGGGWCASEKLARGAQCAWTAIVSTVQGRNTQLACDRHATSGYWVERRLWLAAVGPPLLVNHTLGGTAVGLSVLAHTPFFLIQIKYKSIRMFVIV